MVLESTEPSPSSFEDFSKSSTPVILLQQMLRTIIVIVLGMRNMKCRCILIGYKNIAVGTGVFNEALLDPVS
jgi:hypothetical protein